MNSAGTSLVFIREAMGASFSRKILAVRDQKPGYDDNDDNVVSGRCSKIRVDFLLKT
jgi:hypothetical protein